MLELDLSSASRRPLTVLCLGAHGDDIEIGCGGTLLSLRERPEVEFVWVVFTSDERRAAEVAASAASFLGDRVHLEVLGHRDGFLPHQGAAVKEDFERLKGEIQPDLVFTHCREDLHQDHRLINELTWNTFRDHLVLEYEIPKWDGDLGRPQAFVSLGEDTAREKTRRLIEAYGSQRSKRWFTEELFLSLMRIRGMECNAPSGYAEAFHVRKLGLRP